MIKYRFFLQAFAGTKLCFFLSAGARKNVFSVANFSRWLFVEKKCLNSGIIGFVDVVK